jgi:CRP-like cAMP-binding protein
MTPTCNARARDLALVTQVVGNLNLFAGLPPAILTGVARQCRAFAVPRGTTFLARGALLPGIFALVYGSAKLALRAPHNEERVLRLVSNGQTFGESAAILGRESSYDAIALAESKLVVIPAAQVLSLLERDSRFARQLVTALAETKLGLLSELESSALRRGSQRLARYLDSLAEPAPVPGRFVARLPASKTLIASRLDMKKETLSRLLRSLAEQGVIEVRQREITILDRKRLAQMAPLNGAPHPPLT